MELREYLTIFLKRGWIIIVAVIIGVAGAVAFSRMQTPIYRSTIYLNVWPERLEWGLQQTIKGLMRNYAGIIRSRQNAAEVVDRLQLDLAPAEVVGKLTVRPVEADLLIQIDADDHDPLRARDIAQTTAEVFVEQINAHMLKQDKRDRVEVSMRDYALPGHLHKPKWKINALAGAILGGLIGVAIAFLLEWLEADIIRTSDDVEEQIGVAVLGVVPAASDSAPRMGRSHA